MTNISGSAERQHNAAKEAAEEERKRIAAEKAAEEERKRIAAEKAAYISGNYAYDIQGGLYFQPIRDLKLVIVLKQSSNDIIGTDVSQREIIKGTRKGDTIRFKLLTPITGFDDVWKVSPDGSRLEGTWSSSVAGGGKWNLTKIQ